MNDYYPKNSQLTRAQWHRSIWLIRDYENLKTELDSLIDEPQNHDGQPRGTETSDPTSAAAIRRENLRKQVRAVDLALARIPEEYRAGVWGIVHDGKSHYQAGAANENTWKRWKRRFIYLVAVFAGICSEESKWRAF